MYLFSFVAILVAYLCVNLYKKWKVYSFLLANFNCPPRHPFFGTLHHFPSNAPGIFATFQSLMKTYGKNFLLTRPIFMGSLMISDPKDVEAILTNPNTKKAKKGVGYKLIEPWLGTGLLTAYGDKWFTRRKIITPSFHFSILDGFVEVMCEQSDILVKYLKAETAKGDVDIYPLINAFTLDVICETSMGVTVNAQANPNAEYVTTVKKISTALQKRGHHVLGRTFLYDLTEQGKLVKKMIGILHRFTNRVIEERRSQILANNAPNKGGRMNFLDILLHATSDGKPLANDDIREEVDTFMFEGHDTTASGIAFTLYLLARHPDVQEKVYEELKDVLGSKDNMQITTKSLGQLIYLDMVIKESLRLLPPVPAIARQLMEDTSIGGVTIPTGVNMVISIYAMQHDPDNFPDPEKFDPERFNPSNPQNKRGFAYVPFSAGGRNCIGQKFAVLDLKASLAKVLMNFKLFPGPEVTLQGDLILKSSNGVKLRLEER